LETYLYTYKDKLITTFDISPVRYFSVLLYSGDRSHICIDVCGYFYRLVWPLSSSNFMDISHHCRVKNIRGLKALKIFLNAIIYYNKNICNIKYNLK